MFVKKPQSYTTICRFLQGIWLHTRGEGGAKLETVVTIMMLYKNMKVKVCSTNRDTDFFDIVTEVLQGDTLALYLFIICFDYVLRTSIDLMKENRLTLEKARSRQYPARTISFRDLNNLLNKRSELVAKCHHESKYSPRNLAPDWATWLIQPRNSYFKKCSYLPSWIK